MPSTPTEVANMALGVLGEARIADITIIDNALSELMDRFFKPGRDAVLEMAPWHFATGWQRLVKMTETPAANWRVQFALPENPDCLSIWQLSCDDDIDWERAFDPVTKQQVIYTDWDEDNMGARCTFLIEDTTRWSPIGIQALAYKIAGDVVLSKTGQTQKWQAITNAMNTWISQATAKSGRQRAYKIETSSNFARVRGGTGRTALWR